MNAVVMATAYQINKKINEEIDAFFDVNDYKGIAIYLVQNNYYNYRNLQLIERLKECPFIYGRTQRPIIEYFLQIISMSKLNDIESIELCKINLKKTDFYNKLIWSNKMTLTEELGDLFIKIDPMFAYNIYKKINIPSKINVSYAVIGMYDKLNFPDWTQIIKDISSLYPEKIKPTLTYILDNAEYIDPLDIANAIFQHQLYSDTVYFLTNYLSCDFENQSELQTILFEAAIKISPQTVIDLLQQELYSHFDRQKIGALLEENDLYEQALEIYDDLQSIKKCIVQTVKFSQYFLIKFCGTLNEKDLFDCLEEIFLYSKDDNITFINIVQTYSKKIGASKIFDLCFEYLQPNEIIQLFSKIVEKSDDSDLHFIYIKVLIDNERYIEVNKMCEQSNHLCVKNIFKYLIQKDIPDKKPLITLSVRFDLIKDVTIFFFRKQYFQEIRQLAQIFNPFIIIGEKILSILLKFDAQTNFLKEVISIIYKTTPIDMIFNSLLKFNYLYLLNDVIDILIKSKSTDVNVHNIIVIHSILLDRNAEKTIIEDKYFDPKYVGDFLSKYNPYYACIAYEKGNLVNDFIDLTNKYKFFSKQAQFCIYHKSKDLWARILSRDNKNLTYITNAIISEIINVNDNDIVYSVIRAYIDAKINPQLLELLEKLIFGTLTYKNDTFIQDILITFSILYNPARIKSYLYLLNNYSIDLISEKLIEAKLYDEAIFVYNKFGEHAKALELITNHKNKSDITCIKDYKINPNDPNVEKNLLQNFIKILENKNLDDTQSIELCNHVLSQNKNDLLLYWENDAKNEKTKKNDDYSKDSNTNEIQLLDNLDDMTKIELIGQGGTSQVYKYSKIKYYAVKTLCLNADTAFEDSKNLLKEYYIVSDIKSPYIIKFHGFYTGEKNKPPSIIMSLCHSSLDKQIRSLSKNEKIKIIEEICRGMIKVHLMGIIHCDLKPHNILLTETNHVKISDFGSSKILQCMTLTSSDIEGTLKYIAPERLNEQKFNEKVDIYAFGIILYYILTDGETPNLSLSDVISGKIPKIPNSINKFSKSLILKCTSFDPSQRSSFEEILHQIQNNKLYG